MTISGNNSSLDWHDRPEGLKFGIRSDLDKLSRQNTSGWGLYNGSDHYDMANVDGQLAIKHIIKEAPRTQKDFFFLDIGAGNFHWGENLARELNQMDLPEDVNCHIVSIRGESYEGPAKRTEGHCTIYKLGAFNVEELEDEFKRVNIPLHERVDYAVSRWCFRHLNDPVGTFLQTLNLLRPGSGMFAGDGFFFNDTENAYVNMANLLEASKVPFLLVENRGTRAIDNFILKRPDEKPCSLPLKYRGTSFLEDSYQVGSRNLTTFEWLESPKYQSWKDYNFPNETGVFYGSRELYDWLDALNQKAEQKLLLCMGAQPSWEPLDLEQARPFIEKRQAKAEKARLAREAHKAEEEAQRQTEAEKARQAEEAFAAAVAAKYPNPNPWQEMVAWVEKGDCVVLHSGASLARVYLNSEERVGDRMVHFVNVPPDLLLPGETPAVLEGAGCVNRTEELADEISDPSRLTNKELLSFGWR